MNRLVKIKGDDVTILNTKPPVFEQCKEMFGIDWDYTTFAYYPSIHTKDPNSLSDDIIQHEYIHLKRQKEIGTEVWWEKYLTDNQFRLDEELLAYRRQYNYLKERMDRNELHRLVMFWSHTLGSKSYGFLIDPKIALKEIKNGN